MAWRRAILLGSLALALASVATAQKTCTIEQPGGGTVEYACGAGLDDESAAQADDDPWWADNRTQAVLAVSGIVGSASAGAYTFYRVRVRRRTLADFVRAAERTYAESKAEPWVGAPKLASLRHDVRSRHESGRLEDAQFLELDKRISSYLSRVRMLEVERRFPDLPPAFVSDLRRLTDDGVVSRADAQRLGAHPALWRTAAATRAELVALLDAWAVEDGGHGASPTATVARGPTQN